MSDHPSSQLLAQYQKRTLFGTDFLLVHRHILSCPACYEKCNSPQQFKEDYENLRAALLPQPEETPYHVSPEEARGYVAKRLDHINLEIVEGHLELCDDCRDAVRRLEKESESIVPARRAARRVLSSAPFAPRWMSWARVAALAAAVLITLSAALLLGPKLFKRSEVADRATALKEVNAGQEPGADNTSSSANAGGESAVPAEANTGPEIAPAREVLVLHDEGHRLTLDAKGNLSGAEQYPPALQQTIKRMLSTERVPHVAEIAELRGSPGTLLGEAGNGPSFRLLSPVGKIILSNRPSFSWQPLAGASSYTVTVTDERLNEVATSGPLTMTSWTVTKPLPYGGRYAWQVMAVKDGKQIISPVLPSPPARFKILDQSRVRELESARKRYADSHLALAALYSEAGLRDEATAELSALLRANPQSRVVRNLLRDARR